VTDLLLRQLEREATQGDSEATERVQRARLRAGQLDHVNLSMWANDVVRDLDYQGAVLAMLGLMKLLGPQGEAETVDEHFLSNAVSNIEAWLSCPGQKPASRDLGIGLGPEWAHAPGMAIRDPERTADLFAMAVKSARGELVIRAIEKAGVEMSQQPAGGLMRDPRFDLPAVQTIRAVVVSAGGGRIESARPSRGTRLPLSEIPDPRSSTSLSRGLAGRK
jgi:hypothetical protein